MWVSCIYDILMPFSDKAKWTAGHIIIFDEHSQVAMKLFESSQMTMKWSVTSLLLSSRRSSPHKQEQQCSSCLRFFGLLFSPLCNDPFQLGRGGSWVNNSIGFPTHPKIDSHFFHLGALNGLKPYVSDWSDNLIQPTQFFAHVKTVTCFWIVCFFP